MDCNVRNANYQRVMAVIEQVLREESRDLCSCQRCMNDVAALALNYLPPHYYVEQDGKRELGSPWLMVETAVREAIERVKELPHHHR